jgi:hypothetical protein
MITITGLKEKGRAVRIDLQQLIKYFYITKVEVKVEIN